MTRSFVSAISRRVVTRTAWHATSAALAFAQCTVDPPAAKEPAVVQPKQAAQPPAAKAVYPPVRGTVRDPQGQPIVGAIVELRVEQDLGENFLSAVQHLLTNHPFPFATTDQNGDYAMDIHPSLRGLGYPTSYCVMIDVRAKGFIPHLQKLQHWTQSFALYDGSDVVLDRVKPSGRIQAVFLRAPAGSVVQTPTGRVPLDNQGRASWIQPLVSRSGLSAAFEEWQMRQSNHDFALLHVKFGPRGASEAALLKRECTLLAPGYSQVVLLPLPVDGPNIVQLECAVSDRSRLVAIEAPETVQQVTGLWRSGRSPFQATVNRDAFYHDRYRLIPTAAWAEGCWAAKITDDRATLEPMASACTLPALKQPRWMLKVVSAGGGTLSDVVAEFFTADAIIPPHVTRTYTSSIPLALHAKITQTHRANANGEIELGPRGSEPIMVRIRALAHRNARVFEPHRIAARGGVVRLEHLRSTLVEIPVVDGRDRPLAGAHVMWPHSVHEGSVASSLSTTDSEGFLRGSLPVGTHQIWVQHEDGGARHTRIEVPANKTAQRLAPIKLGKQRIGRTQLLDPTGAPVPYQPLTYDPGNRRSDPSETITDSRGMAMVNLYDEHHVGITIPPIGALNDETVKRWTLDEQPWAIQFQFPKGELFRWAQWQRGGGFSSMPSFPRRPFSHGRDAQALALHGLNMPPNVWIEFKTQSAFIDTERLQPRGETLNLAANLCHLHVELQMPQGEEWRPIERVTPSAFKNVPRFDSRAKPLALNNSHGDNRSFYITALPTTSYDFEAVLQDGAVWPFTLNAPAQTGAHQITVQLRGAQ